MYGEERDMRGSAGAGKLKLGLTLIGAALAAMLLLAAPASADLEFCPAGEGAGQCGTTEELSAQRGLAVDTESGRLYVADEVNNRIDVFEADGDFLLAFGWGVDTGAAQLETCTTASTCQKGIAGSRPGQFNGSTSVAVDNDPASPSHHDFYVGDRGVKEEEGVRVQKFDPSAEFIWVIGKEVNKTTGADLCTKASGNLCGKAAYDENVAAGGFASAVFLGVGPGGVLDVIDNPRPPGQIIKQRLQRFEAGGAPSGPAVILTEGELKAARAMAVDSAGDLWVGSQEEGLRKYSPTGTPLAGPIADSDFPYALAIDAASGDLYLSRHDKSFRSLALYDPSGTIQRRFAYSPNPSGSYNGLAAHTSAFGEVFFSIKEAGIEYAFLPPPGPIAPPAGLSTVKVGAAKATVAAEINPEGKPTTVHFDFVAEATYLKDIEDLGPGHGFDHAASTAPQPLGDEGFSLKAAEAEIGCPDPATEAGQPASTCLIPETAYRFRVVATNPDGSGEGSAEGPAFQTPAAPQFGQLYATAVGTDSAILHAALNPQGIPTVGWFEYVDDAAYQQDLKEGGDGFAAAAKAPDVDQGQAPLAFGPGEDFAARQATIDSLQPATLYHYRLVADNPLAPPALGKEVKALRTFAPAAAAACPNAASRIGLGALLPDCRAYEMVSPLDKASGDIHLLETTLAQLAVLEQASLSGDKLAYGSYRSFGGNASAPYTSQYIAQRIPGLEWRTHPIDSPRGVSRGLFDFDTEFGAFSADLCEAWKMSFADPPLAEGALAGSTNLYRRTDELCSEDGAAHYEALAPNPSGPPREQLLGVSADGTHAIFSSLWELAPGGTEGQAQLYESLQGSSPRFVCVLPDGAPLSETCTAGTLTGGHEPGAQIGRISADGERVFWAALDGGEAKLYLRQNSAEPESARLHGAASGKGDLIGPAAGAGNVINGSALVKGAKAESGAFAVGQKISDSGGAIPAAATIVKIEETGAGVFTLTLSAAAKATKLGDPLTGQASEKVSGILTETGAFEAGQEISAPGIPPATTVISCSPACGPEATSLTLSVKATRTEPAASLSATSPCTEAATKACTIPVSAAAEEAQGTSASWFWGAAADGSKAIFSTGNLRAGEATLYEFDVDGETTTPIAAGVFGVMGISEDAKRVYFASSKVLTGEEENSNGDKAQAGKANLYLLEAGGGTEFIGTLAGADQETTIRNQPYREHTALIAPDGAHAAFASFAPLSGYDNTEAAEDDCEGVGKGDACREIYRYDAESNQLLCVSCNPSGARPAGSSTIPDWVTAMHASRVLSDDGARLFFESADALTPRDTNGQVDVYQWEEAGAGPPGAECTESLPTYSAQDEGCVSLISSGQNPQDSRFVEADPSGANVFIATGSGLLPQDPGGVDIYDARVNGGLPIPQGPPPSCEDEACQGVTEAPNDPTPASLSFEGAGNVREEPAAQRPKPCAKGKVKRHGRCVARKHAAKKHKRAKRHGRAGR